MMHPMVKTLKAAMRKCPTLKPYASKLNSNSLDQCLTFGYCKMHYTVKSLYDAAGYGRLELSADAGQGFTNWLPCDSEYKTEWLAFDAALKELKISY